MEGNFESKKGFKNDLRGTDDLISTYDLHDYLVVDFGSEITKVGFSGVDYPKILSPTIVGVPNNENDTDLTATKLPSLFGNHAITTYGEKLNISDKAPDYSLKYPVNRAMIENEDVEDFKKYCKNIFENQLQMDSNKTNVLIIDSPHHSKEYRNKIAEWFFEGLRVASINFLNSSVLSLFSTGLTEGLVIEMGHGRTSVVPIYGGYTLSHAMHSVPFGGKDATDYLSKHFLDKGVNFSDLKYDPGTLVREIKEKLSVMPMNYNEVLEQEDSANVEEKCFELPDGNIIEVDHKTRYTTAELLMNPSVIGSQETDLITNIYDSFMRVDKDLRKVLYNSIVLCGGASMTRGLHERLQWDLDRNCPDYLDRVKFDIRADSNRYISAWIGGSMIASISTFQSLSIKKSEYDEGSDGRLFLINKRTL